MKRHSRIVLVAAISLSSCAVGATLGAMGTRHVMKSGLSTTIAAGYSAEGVRLALVGGSLEDANTAVRKHIAFLEEARPVMGDFAYQADKMRVLASLAVRYERSGLGADAQRTQEEALESCRLAKLNRCSIEEVRILGERAYRQ